MANRLTLNVTKGIPLFIPLVVLLAIWGPIVNCSIPTHANPRSMHSRMLKLHDHVRNLQLIILQLLIMACGENLS
jgi:hypothetical protein